jgi:hypothetical protein
MKNLILTYWLIQFYKFHLLTILKNLIQIKEWRKKKIKTIALNNNIVINLINLLKLKTNQL